MCRQYPPPWCDILVPARQGYSATLATTGTQCSPVTEHSSKLKCYQLHQTENTTMQTEAQYKKKHCTRINTTQTGERHLTGLSADLGTIEVFSRTRKF